MSTPAGSLAALSAAPLPVGAQPVQSVAMALLRGHDLVDNAEDSIAEYRVLTNHLSFELAIARGVFGKLNEKVLRGRGMDRVEIEQGLAACDRLQHRFRTRKRAHDVRVRFRPVPGTMPRYLVWVDDPWHRLNNQPTTIFAADLAGTLKVLHESAKEAAFEESVAELFEIHLEEHNLLADAGEIEIGTKVSNLEQRHTAKTRAAADAMSADAIRRREERERVLEEGGPQEPEHSNGPEMPFLSETIGEDEPAEDDG